MNNRIILTDLDSLLDTRLAILYEMDKDKTKILLNEGYYERESDVFDGFDTVEFRDRYTQRDKVVLKNSFHTCIYSLATEIGVKMMAENKQMGKDTPPKILVNTYPYLLSSKEMSLLTKALIVRTKNLIEIELRYIPYEEMTPLWMNNTVEVMFMYDYMDWIELHAEKKSFEKTLCSEVDLLAPRVVKNTEGIKMDMDDYFTDMERFIGPYICTTLISTVFFSMALNFDGKMNSKKA